MRSSLLRHGDLLPPLPNTPEASPGPGISVLPPYASPCVLLLRSLSLRLLHAPAAANDIILQLEALELTDAGVAKLSPEAQSKAWPWGKEKDKRIMTERMGQTEYYLLKDCRETNKETLIGYIALNRGPQGAPTGAPIEVQRIFVAPNRRRSGIAEAFFGSCMLTICQQQPQVTCLVPRLAIKVMESMGFSEAPGAPKEEGSLVVPVSVELRSFVDRLLRP